VLLLVSKQVIATYSDWNSLMSVVCACGHPIIMCHAPAYCWLLLCQLNFRKLSVQLRQSLCKKRCMRGGAVLHTDAD
jgi:hypothetical protein